MVMVATKKGLSDLYKTHNLCTFNTHVINTYNMQGIIFNDDISFIFWTLWLVFTAKCLGSLSRFGECSVEF